MTTDKKSDFCDVTCPKQRLYLANYGETGSHLKAAEAAGVTVRTGYNWRNDSRPEFKEFQECLRVVRQTLCDRVEGEIIKRAIEDGDNVMLIFLAKKLMPSYRESYKKPGAEAEAIEAARREKYDQIKQHEIARIEEVLRLQELFAH